MVCSVHMLQSAAPYASPDSEATAHCALAQRASCTHRVAAAFGRLNQAPHDAEQRCTGRAAASDGLCSVQSGFPGQVHRTPGKALPEHEEAPVQRTVAGAVPMTQSTQRLPAGPPTDKLPPRPARPESENERRPAQQGAGRVNARTGSTNVVRGTLESIRTRTASLNPELTASQVHTRVR